MNDAVVLLITKSPPDFDDKFEYRVAYVPNIEDLYEGFNDATDLWEPNVDYILDLFAEVDIYTNPDDAFVAADTIMYSLNRETTHGICAINDFDQLVFCDL